MPGCSRGAISYDRYESGDLSGKYGSLAGKDDGAGRFVDPNLALFGPFSVEGRSVVLHETPGVPHRLACANIESDAPKVPKVQGAQGLLRPTHLVPDGTSDIVSPLYATAGDRDRQVHVPPGREGDLQAGSRLSSIRHFRVCRVSPIL